MSLDLTMRRAFDLLEDNLRQKQKNYHTTMRSDEKMERLRYETQLEKQRLANQGDMAVTDRQQTGETRRTGMTQEGQLAQQLAANTGATDVANIRGDFSLEKQGLVNQGDMAVTNRREVGATNRANIQVDGTKYVADLENQQARNQLALDKTIAGNEYLVNQYSAIKEGSGNMLGEGGNSFAQGYADMQQLAFTPEADGEIETRVKEIVTSQSKTNTGKTNADNVKKPEEKRRTTANDQNKKNARSNPNVLNRGKLSSQTQTSGAGPRSSVAWPRSSVPALGKAVNRRTGSMIDRFGRINRLGR